VPRKEAKADLQQELEKLRGCLEDNPQGALSDAVRDRIKIIMEQLDALRKAHPKPKP
jgi:hypothetical protein